MMQRKIVIHQLNQVFMVLECDRATKQELREYFSFFAENYKFSPKYKNRIWDGKIALYNLSHSTLYIGLIDRLKMFASSYGYYLEDGKNSSILRDSNLKTKDDESNMMDLIQEIKSIPNRFTLRDYQLFAAVKGIQLKRAILLAPTGAGKSILLYSWIRWFNDAFQKPVLVIVPTIGLVNQMKSDFIDYDSSLNPDSIIGIYSGQDRSKVNNKNNLAIISTYQSLVTFPIEFFEQFRMVINDEVHGAKTTSIKKIMEMCVNAEYRIGTTGTLPVDLLSVATITGLFGKPIKTVTTKQLQQQQILSELEIKCLKINYTEEDRKRVAHEFKTYQEEVKFLMDHEKRKNLITKYSLTLKGNSLILFNRVEFGKEILQRIKNLNQKIDRKLFLIYGGTAADDRELIRKIVETETDSIIVASFPTFSTGINIRNLHNIVFSQGGKSSIRIIQSIGRGLRIAENGQSTTLIDFVDDLTYGKRESYSIKHAAERLSIYIDQKFPFKVIDIDLD
jgi:superfamily II DNA or RNA helicase